MKLYKYMNPQAGKLFLDSPFLRITPKSCLNDPFEIQLSASTKDQIDQLDLTYSPQDGRSTSMKFEDFMKKHGVISFSETYDNLLMWSHYASEHKGIAVEFNIDMESPFSLFNVNHISGASDLKFGKVNYRKKREYPAVFGVDDVSMVAEHYYLTKSDEWIYEKEHRFIVPFTMANKILVDRNAMNAKDTLKDLGIAIVEHGEAIIDVTMQAHLKGDWEGLASAFENSHNNGFIFLICLNEQKISRLFLGVNSNISEFSSLIDNAYDCSPYVSYRSIMDDEYSDVYKGVVHDSRFEVNFELLRKKC